ncbi:uncharacterized protein LOC111131598 [Crassostrea virginica]
MRCWCILFVVLNFYKGQTARLFQPLSTTDNEGTKNTDILRQLLNQETLIRLSLSRDVQFLLKQQRTEKKTDQAVKKTLVDLQASVQRLTNVTDDLNLRNENLTNEVTSLILKNKQELEVNDRSQDKKLGVLERYLEELSNQTTQQLMFIGDVNSNIKNMSTQIAGLETDLLGFADAIVQGACAAVSSEGHVSAVRRTCSKNAPSCDQVCKGATSQMKSKSGTTTNLQATCFQAYHFYGPESKIRPGPVGQVNRIMYRYNPASCSGEFCGPNYCCCRL